MEKVKKQMSANANVLPLNIECLIGEKDFSSKVDRATFEEMIQPELKRIKELLEECLKAANWKQGKLLYVDIIGSPPRGIISDIPGIFHSVLLYTKKSYTLSIVLQLEDTEDWLYGDGNNCEKTDYVNKLNELKIFGQSLEPEAKTTEESMAEPTVELTE